MLEIQTARQILIDLGWDMTRIEGDRFCAGDYSGLRKRELHVSTADDGVLLELLNTRFFNLAKDEGSKLCTTSNELLDFVETLI